MVRIAIAPCWLGDDGWVTLAPVASTRRPDDDGLGGVKARVR